MTTSTVLQPLPSRTRLAKATLVALAVAAAILGVAVLPAEHGIDPTGLGRRLGLLGMSASAPDAKPVAENPATPVPTPVVPVATSATLVRNEYVVQSATPFRSGDMHVTLGPDKGAEIKAKMRKGEQFTFAWSTGAGPVEFDMHGEETNTAKDEFTSY